MKRTTPALSIRSKLASRIPPELEVKIDNLDATTRTLIKKNVELERKLEYFAATMDLTPEELDALSQIIGIF